MSRHAPIDLEGYEVKVEEDLYGEQIKYEVDQEEDFTSPTLKSPRTPTKPKQKGTKGQSSPYGRNPVHRVPNTPPDELDKDDSILVTLKDHRGMDWVYCPGSDKQRKANVQRDFSVFPRRAACEVEGTVRGEEG
jgi:hypothetical protein